MKKAALAALVLAATALPALAQQPMKPEEQIKLRKSTMDLIGYNFGSLSAMAQGKKPFDKDEAARNADLVAQLSALPRRFFGEGTDLEGKTKAKPAIWQHRADFDKKMDHMGDEARKLPEAARSGDMEAFKKQVSETGHACKSCHDDYKSK
ncbi:MAG TPA: cytochrome c [Usitatibacter sp.]|nr:cytochrome c [Usitatibacter sp.]